MIVLMTVKERTRREDAVRQIEAEVAAAAGALNVAHGRRVEVAGELIETELWKGYGVKSVEHWLGWHAGLSPERARQITAVAGELIETELWKGYGVKSVEHWLGWHAGLSPERARQITAVARRRRELSVDQVIAVAKHTPAHNDAEVASFAKVETVTQL